MQKALKPHSWGLTMAILSPVDVERFHVDHKHPFYNAELQKRAIEEQWVVMCDGREIKMVIGFDKKNRFVKYTVTDETGKVVIDKSRKEWAAKTAYAHGDVHVFTHKGAQ
jgi:hypothetical protein